MDIDISSLLKQYLTIIEDWQEKNLDVASEFLAMASKLVYMKTVSLLPRHEDEIEKLHRDLSGQLMEYRICKIAAELLEKENQYADIFVRNPLDIDIDPTYKQVHPPQILYNALIDAMGKRSRRKPPSEGAFSPLVTKPIVSVASKILTVLRTLRVNDNVLLESLFDPEIGRSGLVATFLAVLELMKSGRIVLIENTLAMA